MQGNGELMRQFAGAAWIDGSVRIAGNVEIGEGSSVWPFSVIRAEGRFVKIGRFTNLQDHTIVHVGRAGTTVGDYCSITHRVTLHGCTIEDNCLIGINVTIMDGSVIGANSIVAGHSFVREGTIIPPNSIVMGTPAMVVRTANNFVANRMNAWSYYWNARSYARGDFRGWDSVEFTTARAAERERLEAEFARTTAAAS